MFGTPALDQANAELTRVYALLAAAHARTDALVQELVQLRRDGFMQPSPGATVPDRPRAVIESQGESVDAVIEHYAALAPNESAARRVLQTEAIRLRAIGKDDAAICIALRRGDPITGEDDDE